MKTVNIPSAIRVNFPGGNDTISFVQFLTNCIDGSKEIKTFKQLRMALKIIDKIERSGSTSVTFEDEEYEFLKTITDGLCYIPLVAKQLLPFRDAIENATGG